MAAAAAADDDFDEELPLPEPFEWANRTPAPPVGDETVFTAAARGDIAALRYFAEHLGAAVDERDAFDATPLYYACLCGRYACAEYLLARGARSDPLCFDAERCRYAALTDDLRRLLKLFGASAKQRGPFLGFAFRIHNVAPSCGLPDLELEVRSDGTLVRAHRCVLAARCATLARLLRTRWRGRARVALVDPRLRGPVLVALLGVLYTERLLTTQADLAGVGEAAHALGLAEVEAFCAKEAAAAAAAEARAKAAGAGGASGGGRHAVCKEFGVTYALGSLPGEGDAPGSLRGDLWRFLVRNGGVPDAALLDHRAVGEEGEGEREKEEEVVEGQSAACGAALNVEDDDGGEDGNLHSDLEVVVRGHHFRLHSAFLCGRSPFFASLLAFADAGEDDSFSGGGSTSAAPPTHGRRRRRRRVTLRDISPFVFAVVCEFIYADAVREMPTAALALEALAVADAYMLRELTPLLVARAAAHLRRDTLVDLFGAASVFNLHKLTAAAARFAAADLDYLAADGGGAAAAFPELARRDAAAVRGRQEFDSIPVLDEVRAELLQLYAGAKNFAERARRLALLEALRAKLGLKGRL